MSRDKEFVAVYSSDLLADNYARLLKDTSMTTQLSYHKRFVGWGIDNPEDLLAFIDNLEDKWQDGEYRYPTIRQYKATLGYAISNAYQFKRNPKELNYKYREYYELSKLATTAQLEELYLRCMSLGRGDDIRALDKQASYNEKTSSTKDKRFPKVLLDRILMLKDSSDENKASSLKLLQDFLVINTKIGLRPIEYQNATLIRHDLASNEALLSKLNFDNLSSQNALNLTVKPSGGTKPLLLVKNAKNSHSRACGDYRLLYLDVLSDQEIETLKNMMLTMRDISESSSKSFTHSVVRPLGSKLYYLLTTDKVCKGVIKSLHNEKLRSYRKQSKTQFRNEPIFKRPTLYSTRHQAVANAKADKLHPVMIAACFGHSSILTAESHYGKSVFGSGGGLAPAQVSINEVVARLTDAQLAPRERNIQDRLPDNKPKPSSTPTPRFAPK